MKPIEFEIDLPAPIEKVWWAWTTPEGIRSFFASGSNIELRPGGPYEIFFDMDAEPGHRGADGMLLMAFQEPTMLSFTWNAPEDFPEVRPHLSHVTLRLQALPDGQTRLHFTEDGYGEGGQWEARYQYFVRAWGSIVLPLLAYSLAEGPVDWPAGLPELAKYREMVKPK